MNKLTLVQPDDWHCHLRDGQFLHRTVTDSATRFGRVLVMPNLNQPVTTVSLAQQYRERILSHMKAEHYFEPILSLYLTEQTTVDELNQAAQTDYIKACKLYPAHATTNSAHGVHDIKNLFPLFEAMQENGLLLLIHGESTDPNTDVFDREKQFIEQHLKPIVEQFPNLRIVLEHITTKDAVDFVSAAPSHVAATITAHHLLYNRNAIFQGGIRPDYYCLPILKRERHQQALIKAATGGSPKFFLGTDSAPHTKDSKHNRCGCAGIYTAHAAIELYAEVFEQHNALDKLENFASRFGAEFYGLPINPSTITLIKQDWTVPDTLAYGDSQLTPLRAGEKIHWTIV